ncbi:hypothetical protein RJ639_006775 [Escallonia herrerae]|uniref:Retrovirus-related Pol polyprotein from transposon TNT 1-94 n=1 Tax=Escallonia herrerae TaxID=1293975 RepID=A0AA88VY43_9ASTE|nr:hypothetical protein RJ639_006775 [Escallonia herrerae]
MKSSITTAIRGAIPDSDNAKLYLAHIEEQFQGSSKAHATTLITKMVTLKYSGSNGVREHILWMNDMASQLKGLDMEFFKGFLLHFTMTSLPTQFGPFKINYNTQKEKWKMSELISMCVQEEERLKSEKPDSAHVAITGCVDTLKSLSGNVFMLAEGLVSWKSAKQSFVASHTMEAEFVACFEASCHGVWLRNFITGLKVVDTISRPLKIFCDNQATIFFSKNNKSSGGTKHIEIKYLVVKERIQNQIVSIQHIITITMLANPMTKGLPPTLFRKHVASMEVKEEGPSERSRRKVMNFWKRKFIKVSNERDELFYQLESLKVKADSDQLDEHEYCEANENEAAGDAR